MRGISCSDKLLHSSGLQKLLRAVTMIHHTIERIISNARLTKDESAGTARKHFALALSQFFSLVQANARAFNVSRRGAAAAIAASASARLKLSECDEPQQEKRATATLRVHPLTHVCYAVLWRRRRRCRRARCCNEEAGDNEWEPDGETYTHTHTHTTLAMERRNTPEIYNSAISLQFIRHFVARELDYIIIIIIYNIFGNRYPNSYHLLAT